MTELGTHRLLPQLLAGGLSEAPRAGEGMSGLLEFLAPGLVHELNNAVFKIQGNAQTATLPGATGRGLGEVLKHAKQAQATLELLRSLVPDDGGAGTMMQCGVLLPQICALLGVPMRRHGLVAQFRHSSRQSPGLAPVTTTARAVLGLAKEIAHDVPLGFRGVFLVDLVQQTPVIALRLAVTGNPAMLPFPIDLRPALARSGAWLASVNVHAEATADGRELDVRIPVVDGTGAV